MRKYCGTPRETIPFRILDFFVDIYANVLYKKQKLAPIHNNAPRILGSFPEHLICVFYKTITIYNEAGLQFFPLTNFPIYLIHNHKPSVRLPFERKNV